MWHFARRMTKSRRPITLGEIAQRHHRGPLVSVSHGFDHVVFQRGLAALHPRRWKLWAERRGVVAYILTVDVVAVALLAGVIVAIPVRSEDLFRFCLLVAGAVLHQEAVRQIEIQRERTVGSGLLPNLKSLWIFAAVLSVPLPLV